MPIVRQWFTERIADAGNLIDDTVPAIRVVPVRHHGERAVRNEDYRASIAWRCLDMTGDLLDHTHILTLARVEPFDGALDASRVEQIKQLVGLLINCLDRGQRDEEVRGGMVDGVLHSQGGLATASDADDVI